MAQKKKGTRIESAAGKSAVRGKQPPVKAPKAPDHHKNKNINAQGPAVKAQSEARSRRSVRLPLPAAAVLLGRPPSAAAGWGRRPAPAGPLATRLPPVVSVFGA